MEKTGIVLFAFNRPEHTKQVLEGLYKNNINKLYVFVDGVPENVDEENRKKINEVRNIIQSIDWCETETVFHDTNMGLKKNWISGFNYVLNKHSRIIAVEDDCVPSSDFVDFMEACLDKYENNPQVMNIHGYAFPVNIPSDYSYDVYFNYRTGSWGQATWKRAWDLFEMNYNDFERIRKSKSLKKQIDKGGKDLFFMMADEVKGKSNSVGIWWSWSVIKNNGLCIHPTISRIKNIGHDKTGTHCKGTDRYQVNLSAKSRNAERLYNLPDKPFIDNRIEKKIKAFLKPSIMVRMKKKLQIFIN